MARAKVAGSKPIVLGLTGGVSSSFLPEGMFHDSAVVLTRGGEIVAAVEEERLNRIKHTNKLPLNAIRACLDMAGTSLAEVDRIAYYGVEFRYTRRLFRDVLDNPSRQPVWEAREYLARTLSRDLASHVDAARIEFVEHHLAHAASAYLVGPFPRALVVTLDGQGDGFSGTVSTGNNGQLNRIFEIPDRDSLGLLYHAATQYLGYGLFDEYKVMGLAPYGEPASCRELFDSVCILEPDGKVRVDLEQFYAALSRLPTPRRASQPLEAMHENFAAALQEAIERAAFHILEHYRKETGLAHLCLAGGVALNSTLAGKLLRSGTFDGVFVQPASHDAGCALGAALLVDNRLAPNSFPRPLSDVYWGRHVGDGLELFERLDNWSELVEFNSVADVSGSVAALLAEGAVVGWVQGRSEFGPRALGNRSILADPRDARTKQRINDLVKAREGYRPFAPAVLEEFADEYFEMTPGSHAAFMGFTVPVREHFRQALGAVTHVDGTARVQTVSQGTNRRFWELIDSFRRLTGIPVLLNTSFNHNVEPIVDSVDDAMTCFLTTGIDYLVVGDYIVTRRFPAAERLLDLVPILPDYVRLVCQRHPAANGGATPEYSFEHTALPGRSRRIGPSAFVALGLSDGSRSMRELLHESNLEASDTLLEDADALWGQRLIRFFPRRVALAIAKGTAAQASDFAEQSQ